MNRSELLEAMRNGEDSGVEFETDGIGKEKLAEDMVSFANFRGGVVLLGVEGDGSVSGLRRQRKEIDLWAKEASLKHTEPAIVPFTEYVRPKGSTRTVAVMTVMGSNTAHAFKNKEGRRYLVRHGTQNFDASHEQMVRLFVYRGEIRFEKQPVPHTDLKSLDRRRLRQYFGAVRGQEVPKTDAQWKRLLRAAGIMSNNSVTAGGMILFGADRKGFLSNFGIDAFAFPGEEKEPGKISDRAEYRGALVPLSGKNGVKEPGPVEEAVDFIRRNAGAASRSDGGRGAGMPEFPEDVLRATLVNAVVHRDYSFRNFTSVVWVLSDRVEIVSHGSPPEKVTPEGMLLGAKAARNPMLLSVMRQYGYASRKGPSFPNTIVRGMREHNGTEPEVTDKHEMFTVRLFAGKKARKRKTPPGKRAG